MGYSAPFCAHDERGMIARYEILVDFWVEVARTMEDLRLKSSMDRGSTNLSISVRIRNLSLKYLVFSRKWALG